MDIFTIAVWVLQQDFSFLLLKTSIRQRSLKKPLVGQRNAHFHIVNHFSNRLNTYIIYT